MTTVTSQQCEGDVYDSLGYSREELCAVMRATYDELIEFVASPEFEEVMSELRSLKSTERPQYIVSVLLSESELRRRGVQVPEGILIQRSAFGDRRPTLFCVKKYLPAKYSNVWQNVNITFDNQFVDSAISREPEIAWRPPLPVALQAETMAAGRSLESI